jgi:DNA mismatch endonuclease (patch repair protein)
VADIYTPEERSRIMSRVRASRNRSTELRAMEVFRTANIKGWRRNSRLPGKPDFIFRDKRLVIFVDGCFWHGCSKHGSMPSNNRNFWKQKLTQNKLRDRLTNRSLRSRGWRVLRIWQHELGKRNERMVIQRIRSALARSASNAAS